MKTELLRMLLLCVFVCILGFVQVVFAPPTRRCVVENPIFQSKGPKSACDTGERIQLSDVAGEAIPDADLYGAPNMGDLILSRGGIWRYDLDKTYICQKHRNDFGVGWSTERKNRPLKFGTGDLVCNMPKELDGFNDHKKAAKAEPGTFLSREQSKAVYDQKQALAPAGTGKMHSLS